MGYDDPFNIFSNYEQEQSVGSALVYTIGALFLLLLGLFGNGVLK